MAAEQLSCVKSRKCQNETFCYQYIVSCDASSSTEKTITMNYNLQDGNQDGSEEWWQIQTESGRIHANA